MASKLSFDALLKQERRQQLGQDWADREQGARDRAARRFNAQRGVGSGAVTSSTAYSEPKAAPAMGRRPENVGNRPTVKTTAVATPNAVTRVTTAKPAAAETMPNQPPRRPIITPAAAGPDESRRRFVLPASSAAGRVSSGETGKPLLPEGGTIGGAVLRKVAPATSAADRALRGDTGKPLLPEGRTVVSNILPESSLLSRTLRGDTDLESAPKPAAPEEPAPKPAPKTVIASDVEKGRRRMRVAEEKKESKPANPALRYILRDIKGAFGGETEQPAPKPAPKPKPKPKPKPAPKPAPKTSPDQAGTRPPPANVDSRLAAPKPATFRPWPPLAAGSRPAAKPVARAEEKKKKKPGNVQVSRNRYVSPRNLGL